MMQPNRAMSSEQLDIENQFVSTSIVAYKQDNSPLILTAVSSSATRFEFASGGL